MSDVLVTSVEDTLDGDSISDVTLISFDGLPAESGGGAVTSVNSQTGTVVLDAGDVGAATEAQGALADTAVQPGDLATVATTGAYSDLTGKPTLGTAAAAATGDFDPAGAATAAQSAAVATSEAYTDAAIDALPDPGSGTVTSVNTVEPVAGDVTLTPADIGAATSAQGALADSATQPGDLGDSASRDVGTSAGTVAAGDDSRITGAAQKASNLGDLASSSSARTNLGLGTSATLDVPSSGDAGTGQVVKGSDTRLTDARTPSAHASTHASAGSDPITIAESQVTNLTTDLAAKAPTSRTLTAGTGLTGGGTLAADRTFTVSYGTTSGTAAQGNDSRLSDARTPTAHASSHGSGQSDAVTLDASQVTRTTNAQTGTTYTLVLADASKFVSLSNASAITLTVPPNSSVAFPTGTEIILAQLGAGQVTIAPGSGVTLNSTPGLKIAAQYGTAALKKTATDTWLVFGRLAA